MRIRIANLIVILIFIVLFFGLLNLVVISGKSFKEMSNKNCIRLLPQEGSRGRILDRNGNLIAGNQLSYDVMILPQAKPELDKTLRGVSGILETGFQELKDTYKKNYTASFIPTLVAQNIEVKKAIALEELKVDYTGVIIQPRLQRAYPYGKLACHVLGYLSEIDHWRLTKLEDYGYKTKDIVGFGGIEERYDYYLRQEEGGMSVEVDHRGRSVRVLGFRPPQNGKDIQLTLDLKIQKVVEDNLGEKIGSVVIMDPYDGEIIALASSPGFDPSIFVKKTDSSLSDLFADPEAPLMNRATTGVYPAGSVFKPVVACAALETGKINSSTTFICNGFINIGKQKFACSRTHNQQDLIEAIAHSCNVFFYRTGLLLGAQLIHDYALKFGFGKNSLVDLPYAVNGNVPGALWNSVYSFSRQSGIPFFTRKKWYDGDTVNLSIGQGDLLVSPLQVARMMAVFANKGTLVSPYIVKTIAGEDISVYQKKTQSLPIKVSTIEYINQGLRGATFDTGTANILSTLPIAVAGKTGTAQTGKKQPHGWFAGFFPYENPKFVICVFLEYGGSGYMASVLTKQIIEQMSQEGLI